MRANVADLHVERSLLIAFAQELHRVVRQYLRLVTTQGDDRPVQAVAVGATMSGWVVAGEPEPVVITRLWLFITAEVPLPKKRSLVARAGKQLWRV
ncbi:MAG: hypothetical protein IPK19_17345 [Chloroflexi bacterium]|nr:hypothetical protein [Chloroflexota bacterium]